ncbi:MAG: hypothetical protein ACI84K_001968 [Pseudohongiellaceae bacterium]|jgi:hypothetical protein
MFIRYISWHVAIVCLSIKARMEIMMKKITEGISILQNYALYELSGVVKSENTRSETSVSGFIPSKNSNMAGSVSSQTTTFQTIYFEGEGGKEQAVELVDLIIPCTQGHQLTLWGVNKGAWFDSKNHTTDQKASSKIPLTHFTMPLKTMKHAMYAVMLVFFCIFVGVLADEVSFINVILSAMGAAIIGGIFYLLLLIPGKIVSVIRSNQIMSAKNRYASA